jgi:uncharacterized protein YndB with AHSA1/START domain
MQISTALVTRDVETCWRLFTDVALLTSWVPGLRRAQVITKEHGMPSEIHFEFASSLAYTLVYRYDRDSNEVHWTPKLGKRDGVSGFVRFEHEGGGTRVTYGLEQGDARTAAERALSDPDPVLAAFAARVSEAR